MICGRSPVLNSDLVTIASRRELLNLLGSSKQL